MSVEDFSAFRILTGVICSMNISIFIKSNNTQYDVSAWVYVFSFDP